MTYPITESMYELLEIFENNNQNLSEIAEEHDMDYSTLSRTKDLMKDRGWINEDPTYKYSVYFNNERGQKVLNLLREMP